MTEITRNYQYNINLRIILFLAQSLYVIKTKNHRKYLTTVETSTPK